MDYIPHYVPCGWIHGTIGMSLTNLCSHMPHTMDKYTTYCTRWHYNDWWVLFLRNTQVLHRAVRANAWHCLPLGYQLPQYNNVYMCYQTYVSMKTAFDICNTAFVPLLVEKMLSHSQFLVYSAKVYRVKFWIYGLSTGVITISLYRSVSQHKHASSVLPPLFNLHWKSCQHLYFTIKWLLPYTSQSQNNVITHVSQGLNCKLHHMTVSEWVFHIHFEFQ